MVKQAKRNPVQGVNTFYVLSSKGGQYMVVRIDMGRTRNPLYFCQCSDFFGRRLPHLGRNTFSHCKHIVEVKKRAK